MAHTPRTNGRRRSLEVRLGRDLVWVLLAALVALASSAIGQANPALDWSERMLGAIRADNTGPTLSTRNLAILQVAIYDAVNSIHPQYLPYQYSLAVEGEVSAEAAALAAGREVMHVLYPSFDAHTDAYYEAYVAGLSGDHSTMAGLALGVEAALWTLVSRENDGAATIVPYIPDDAPGQWRRTPPWFRPPLDPHWGSVAPFCLADLDPFVAPGPPALDSAEYARDWEEVRLIGGRDSTVRTPEQGVIAEFWSDFSYTAMPPGHWHEITVDIARTQGLAMVESARLMALMSLAQADAAIVAWEGKYRHNLWRPITAIRRADEDGNAATERDLDWDAYLPAPNFPEYPSGHSTFSKAGAEVLTQFFGTDEITFAARSDSVDGERWYHSLAACADEVGRSRIYGGFHFGFANRDGKASGRKIADYVSANYLLPLDGLPCLWVESRLDRLVSLRLHGLLGHHYVLESSSDFRDWTTLAEWNGSIGGIPYQGDISIEEGRARFFRVREI